ncbi:hypothetical protein [Helicobacter equorum]|uniref:Uncharacterized protein n=1 Tax=Helicobacter equorum TaxID=361872 RepID=A0A3D8IPE2_9HELI|nr:hypothetical protein [Helicobacter equorum]RDU66484.1 hypothetical protein CQA54_07225 [Helicobacter equorum]
MGIRAHIVKEYKIEVGECIGFNYDPEGLGNFLEKFSIRRYADESDNLEIPIEDILNIDLKEIALSQDKAILKSLREACDFYYAKNSGSVKIIWL